MYLDVFPIVFPLLTLLIKILCYLSEDIIQAILATSHRKLLNFILILLCIYLATHYRNINKYIQPSIFDSSSKSLNDNSRKSLKIDDRIYVIFNLSKTTGKICSRYCTNLWTLSRWIWCHLGPYTIFNEINDLKIPMFKHCYNIKIINICNFLYNLFLFFYISLLASTIVFFKFYIQFMSKFWILNSLEISKCN